MSMDCAEDWNNFGVAGKLAGGTVELEAPGVRAVTTRGELDACSCPAWREVLMTQLARADCRILIVDLAEVVFAGASVLNVLVETRATAQRDKIDLRLVSCPRVNHLLELTDLSEQFAVYANRPDAVAALPGTQHPSGVNARSQETLTR
jgi:anti-anti-sigma factor